MECVKLIFNSRAESTIKPARKCLEWNENVIFVCGGMKALCYLPAENKWHKLLNTTLEHKDHCIIQCRDRVYVFSPQKVGDNQSHLVEYYMPSKNSWGAIQTKFDYGDEKFTGLFVLDDNKGLWISTTRNHHSYIYEYNPDKNISAGSLRCIWRWGSCFVSDGHCIFIIGGTLRSLFDEFVFSISRKRTATTKVQKIIPSDETEDGEVEFKKVAPMNEARYDAFGAAMNGKIYVAGGKQWDENLRIERVLASCEVYDPSTDEWQVMPSLNVPRYSASMVCFKGALYVVGGLKSSNCGALSVEMFDSGADEWHKKSNIPVKGKKESIIRFNACFATVHKNCLDD